MADLEAVIAPIGGLWMAHQTIFMSAGFVNSMRETVITGKHEEQDLSKEHAQAIHLDWKLCMGATVFVCFLFSLLIAGTGYFLVDDWYMKLALYFVAAYPGACAALFLRCAVSDSQVIRQAINSRTDIANTAIDSGRSRDQ